MNILTPTRNAPPSSAKLSIKLQPLASTVLWFCSWRTQPWRCLFRKKIHWKSNAKHCILLANKKIFAVHSVFSNNNFNVPWKHPILSMCSRTLAFSNTFDIYAAIPRHHASITGNAQNYAKSNNKIMKTDSWQAKDTHVHHI